jgi:uncharacterized protein (TIGR03435 family)
MSAVASALESMLNEPVFDETGLTNYYDVTLKWARPSPDKPNPENLVRAVREQLGLDLVPAVRPVEMVRIERVK